MSKSDSVEQEVKHLQFDAQSQLPCTNCKERSNYLVNEICIDCWDRLHPEDCFDSSDDEMSEVVVRHLTYRVMQVINDTQMTAEEQMKRIREILSEYDDPVRQF